jgi:hypothetical protein
MCHCNRPHYSRLVLRALSACEGIGDYLLLPHVEPGNDEVRSLVESIDFAEYLPTFNAERLGVNLNTEIALGDGFRRAPFVIHIEDDIVCAPDALRFYEWCNERYANDPGIFSATGYNRRDDPVPVTEWHQVRTRHWFHPWGWASWRDRWQSFRGRLHTARSDWDVFLNETFCATVASPRAQEAYPELSRSQNIGTAGSSADRLPGWYREGHYVTQWAGDRSVPPGEFHD